MYAVADQDFVREFRAFRLEIGQRFDALERAVGSINADGDGGTGVAGELRQLRAHVGMVNDQGDGGSGMAGELARTRVQVRQLINLKWAGTGIVAAVTVFGALLLLGVKAWIGDVIAAIRGAP